MSYLKPTLPTPPMVEEAPAQPDLPSQPRAEPPEPPGRRFALLKLFGTTIRGHARSLLFIMVAAVLSNVLMLLQPLFVMIVYDRVIPHGAFETLWALATGVMLAFLLDLGLRHVRIRMENAVAIKVSIDLQARLFDRLINARSRDSPEAMAEWTDTFREIDGASALVPALLVSVLVDVPFMLAVLLLVYVIAGDVVLAPLVGIAVLAVWTLGGAMVIRRIGARVAQSQAHRTEILTESASLARTLKFSGAQSQLSGRFHWLLAEALWPTHRLRRHMAMQTQLTNFMVQAVIVSAVVLGVYRIAGGDMSIGALVATMLLVGRVLMPAGQCVLLIMRANEISFPLTRIYRLLDLPQEQAAQVDRERRVEQGHLMLNGVSLTYPGAIKPALNSVSVEVSPGEKVALIGRSGSGKSSLLQTLIRMYDPDEGEYLIDGHNALQYAPESLRRDLTYMGQDNELFDGSIHENLRVGAPQADADQIKRALAAAGAFHFVRRNPAGLSLRVGRRGAALSGGERQAICLARALLPDANVLLLDEPTSSMDQTMEGQVVAGLKQLGPKRTLIIATHRVHILSVVDRVIWMDEGRVLADGPTRDVLEMLKKAPQK